MNIPGTGWLDHLERELAQLATQLQAGADVAPPHRARLEGIMELAVDSGWINAHALLQRVQKILPPPGGAVIETGGRCRVQLLLWQRRAPVRPTTAE